MELALKSLVLPQRLSHPSGLGTSSWMPNGIRGEKGEYRAGSFLMGMLEEHSLPLAYDRHPCWPQDLTVKGMFPWLFLSPPARNRQMEDRKDNHLQNTVSRLPPPGLKGAGGLCVDLKMPTRFSRTRCLGNDSRVEDRHLLVLLVRVQGGGPGDKEETQSFGRGEAYGHSCGCKGQAISTPPTVPVNY